MIVTVSLTFTIRLLFQESIRRTWNIRHGVSSTSKAILCLLCGLFLPALNCFRTSFAINCCLQLIDANKEKVC